MIDPYKALGVSQQADSDAIKAAYRKLARKYHPDVNPGNQAAEEKFKEISEAYDILSDPAKKVEYDQLGREAFYERGFGGAGYQRPDFSRGFSFEDIFGDLFGGGQRGQPRQGGGFNFGGPGFGQPRPGRGGDLSMRMSISLREAAAGTTASLELAVPESCPQCQGQGIVASGGGVRTCSNCRGQGQVGRKQTLQANIPAGIKSGQKVRLKGKGSPGQAGGPAGDLLLEVEVRPDSVFTRQDQNLYQEVPVSLYEALLGGGIEVPTLTGRATLKLPAGSQNGQKMRLKGQGFPPNKKDAAGDLFITLKVVLPTKLDERARELVEQLVQAAPMEVQR